MKSIQALFCPVFSPSGSYRLIWAKLDKLILASKFGFQENFKTGRYHLIIESKQIPRYKQKP